MAQGSGDGRRFVRDHDSYDPAPRHGDAAEDGLAIQWFVTLPRQQLNVDVWQLCVSGAGPAR